MYLYSRAIGDLIEKSDETRLVFIDARILFFSSNLLDFHRFAAERRQNQTLAQEIGALE